MRRHWQEAEAVHGGRGVSNGFVHLPIWTVPQQPQITAGNRSAYEQRKQPTWPTSAVRRKAATCLKSPLQHPFGIRQAYNSRKRHMSQQDCSGQAALHKIRPHDSLQTNGATVLTQWCRADASPSEGLSAPSPPGPRTLLVCCSLLSVETVQNTLESPPYKKG